MNQLYHKALLLCFLIGGSTSLLAQTVVSGTITDGSTKEPLAGVNIIVKGSILGTTTAADGKYHLEIKQPPPFTIIFSYIGFHSEEVVMTETNTSYNLAMQVESLLGQEVVVSASRVEESFLKSPVTIEKMDLLAIQQSATPDYYDALANMKGVQVTNSSLTYTSVNTRGFADAQNTRFVQLVDGMDMAEASINVPDGSIYVPGELDAESVELLPGAASALYGPNAFNGIIIMNSKSPFEYQGLSAMVKLGMTNSKNGGSNPMGTYSLRYAKAFNNKLAFKINLYYLGATDWTSNDYRTDRNNPNATSDLSHSQNFDGLNLYGDETPISLQPWGINATIRRTGISENILLDHRRATAVKANAAVHYRINEKTELIGLYHYGAENTIAQSNAKYAYRNGHQQFIKLELKQDHFFIRSYLNIGQAFKSYSLDALGSYANEYFNTSFRPADFSGWITDYVTALSGGIADIAMGDSTGARSYADRFMIDPATGQYVPSFQDTIEKIRSNYFQHYPPGAKFYDKTYTWHSEIFYTLSQIKWADIIIGGNFRQYSLFSNATIFDEAPVDPNDPQKILTNTYGAYTQIAKTISEKIKLSGSIRYDIMDDFEGHFTPRLSMVYSPNPNHNFRISYQTGFRYPEMTAQFIYFDTGPYIALGGVSSIASRYGVYNGGAWTQSSYDDFLQQGGKLDPTTGEILENPGNVTLETANVGYLKPEHLSSYEIGYKGIIASKLLVDLNYYYTSYTNFLGNQFAYNKVSTLHQGQQIPAGRLWGLYLNSPYTITSYGIGLGLTYNLPKNFVINGSYNYADYSGKTDLNFIAGFNTPRNRYSIGIGSREVTRNVGFNINYRYQESFLWESSYGKATMPAYGVLDAQINYKISSIKTMVKLGGTNLGGKDYRTNFGSPFVGQIYYLSFVFDEFMN
jgi:iron complex outermembrane recepter protein